MTYTEKTLRTRVKRRLAGYKHYPLFVLLLECDFIHIFSKAARELKLKDKDFDEIVKTASMEQLMDVNYRFDEYQIQSREERG